MDKRTRTALEGSIAKWEAIVAGTGTDEGTENCPLCQLFFTMRGPQQLFCEGCPVKERTGQTCCEGSPYQEWGENPYASGDEAKRIAQAEVDFLRSLLPPEPDLATLLAEAKERGPMSDAERQAQRESWVRGEMALGNDRDEAAQESRITLNYGTLVPSPLSEHGMLLVNAPDDCNKLVEEPDQ